MVAPVVPYEQWVAGQVPGVLVDVRRSTPDRDATQAHAAGHLPGAVLLDLDRDLAAAPAGGAGGRHPLPEPGAFAAALSRAGVGDGDTVVAYDDEDGVIAARLVWVLRATGRDAALLDGGAALRADLTETGPVVRPPAVTTPRPWPEALLVDADGVLAPGHVLLDARPRERFLGAPSPLDPRPGHLPGARSLPAREHLDADGRLLPREVLRQRLADVGVGEGTPVVSSCGSGVTACHTLLVLEHVGLGAGRLYPGSWSEWAADPSRPVELGGGQDAPA